MLGAVLPGNSTVELRDFPIPEPGHGQVLIKQNPQQFVAVIFEPFIESTSEKVRKDIKTKSLATSRADKLSLKDLA
jgi:hypothetical protein